MDLTVNPQALGNGGTRLVSGAEVLGGHATTVANLVGPLGTALTGAEIVRPILEENLTALSRTFEARRAEIERLGAEVVTTADTFTAVDQANADATPDVTRDVM